MPSALVGVDIEALLDEAAALAATLADDTNPALLLGAALGGFSGRDKVVLAGATPVGLGDWIEQLVAESTGKDGTGLLPVVVESASAPGFTPGPDTHLVVYGETEPEVPETADTVVTGPLGAQFLAWEYAAVAGHLLGIGRSPAERAESKDNTKALLELSNNGTLPTGTWLLTGRRGRGVRLRRHRGGGRQEPRFKSWALIEQIPDDGYLAVMACDRDAEGDGQAAASVRAGRAHCAPAPPAGGALPAPTGQYHKAARPTEYSCRSPGTLPRTSPSPGSRTPSPGCSSPRRWATSTPWRSGPGPRCGCTGGTGPRVWQN